MKKYDNYYRADKGMMFVLTERGKEWASYRNCEVGKPIDDDITYASGAMVEDGALIEVDDPDWVILPGYKVVYDHNGYQISAGNGNIFHDKNMAERMMNNFNNRPWRIGEPKAYITGAMYEGHMPRPCREYEGKTVFNSDWWWGDIGYIGDYVEEKIADGYANCVPPVTYRSNLIQCGEPSSHRYDEDKQDWRYTFSTFKRVSDDVWEYCGNCFKGESKE